VVALVYRPIHESLIVMAGFVGVLLAGIALAIFLAVRRRRRRHGFDGSRRILVPFTGGALDGRVLAAAIRVSQAERATLVPAYLLVVPLRLPPDAPMEAEVARAMPLLEPVEYAALRAGVPVDARIEKGRTPTHALQQICPTCAKTSRSWATSGPTSTSTSGRGRRWS
jgi:hypothetical protein